MQHQAAMATNEEMGKAPVRGNNGAKRKRPQSESSHQKSSGSHAGTSKKTRFGGERPSGIQGASKLKASIRQTKRLLAKDTLAPGTRIEAERRLIALEQDLEKLGQFKLEKNRAAKYHGVKFFERQKLTRKVKKVKRQLDILRRRAEGEDVGSDQDSDNDDDSSHTTANEAQLQQSLTTYRQLLHYVLQYPSDVKYVALFPEGIAEPKLPTNAENDKTVQHAFQHLEYVRKAMSRSKLSNTPEIELEHGNRPKKPSHASPSSSLPADRQPIQNKSKSKGGKGKRAGKDEDANGPTSALKNDEFFDQGSSDDD